MEKLLGQIEEFLRKTGRENGWSAKVDFFARLAENWSDEMSDGLKQYNQAAFDRVYEKVDGD